jgi:Flp pilus assembly protein TadD
MLTLPKVTLAYLGLLAVPARLHMERVVAPVTSPVDPAVLGPATALVLIAAVAVRWRRAAWPLAFGFAWFAVALLPVANLVPLSTFMAEHWLYVPSMGLFMAAGWGLSRLASRAGRPTAIVVLAVLIAAYGVRSARRNLEWRDDRTFYEATLRLAPDSARVHSNLGRVYWTSGDVERAKREFARAIELRPDSWQTADTHNDLGVIYQQEGRHPEAVQEFRRAIELFPRNAGPYVNLATSLEALGRVPDAQQALEHAIALNSGLDSAYTNLGNIFFNRGEVSRARDLYLKAVTLNPEDADNYNNLGSAYFAERRFDLAVKSFRTALQLNSRSEVARRNLDTALHAQAGSGAP